MTKKIMFFTAPWCSGCKTLKPQVEKLVAGTSVEVEYIDVEERGEEASGYGVTNLPTLFFVEDGEFVKARTGSSEATISAVRRFAEE